jgi:cellulose synthase/poly-beta-1,6-N-acetylglucosamine synthase-like glycosyltransferase
MEFVVITLYLMVLGILGIYGFHRGHLLMLYWRHRRNEPKPKGQFEELPLVTIQLPMFNEMYVAERLLEGVARIDYPKDRMEIQVLDDSIDETQEIAARKVEDLKARGFDAVYIHRVDRVGFKAGALEEGLKTARGDYVMVFDADFVPNADIIHNLIHFFTDDKVGMVQARWGHLNREYSMLTRCQSMMLDGHFVIEHIARNRSGGSSTSTAPPACGARAPSSTRAAGSTTRSPRTWICPSVPSSAAGTSSTCTRPSRRPRCPAR